MGHVVTGLSPSGDLTALKAALRTAGLSPDALQVISSEDSSLNLRGRGVIGGDIMSGDSGSGTGVPGLTNVHSGRTFFRDESLTDRLGDLEIPESEIDNYLEAIERGRSVVAYFPHGDAAGQVEEVFRSANLLNVRRY